MNCHKSIAEYKGKVSSESEKAFYDAEIQKIYESNGWDSEKLAYKENYEQKPIVWTKVHNLADFVYFNHSPFSIQPTLNPFEEKSLHGSISTPSFL